MRVKVDMANAAKIKGKLPRTIKRFTLSSLVKCSLYLMKKPFKSGLSYTSVFSTPRPSRWESKSLNFLIFCPSFFISKPLYMIQHMIRIISKKTIYIISDLEKNDNISRQIAKTRRDPRSESV